MRRSAVLLTAALAVAAGCASSGEPYSAPTTPTTSAPTDPAAMLAAERAATATEVASGFFDCEEPRAADESTTDSTTPVEAFAVAFVGPSSESRELSAPLPMPDLGDEAAQLRAFVERANECSGRPIELHVHRDYLRNDDGLAETICDEVVRSERNDLVIARGLPPAALRCVADIVPVLYLGDAPAASGRYFVSLGADSNVTLDRLADDLERAGRPVEGPVALVHDAALNSIVGQLDRNDLSASLEFDAELGCVGLDEAVERFREAAVKTIVALLDERCLPSTGLAMKPLQAQWVIGPLGVGTGDDAIATIAAVADTFDGALATTSSPRAAITSLVPLVPPALGEACNAVAATEGEDYEFGIAEYAALEELCVAVRLVRDATWAPDAEPSTLVAAITASTELPLPSNLLGGFRPGMRFAAGDVVYVQEYESGCGCWQLVAGPALTRD